MYWIVGGVLALGGVVLALWALFWDRSRGRKRCPKCWYSMEGVPGAGPTDKPVWVCPECGKEIRGGRRLARTRRRRAWAGVGALLLLAAYVSIKAPEWMGSDWTALVPTSVLVFVAAAEDPALEGLKQRAMAPAGGGAVAGQIPNAFMRRPPLGRPGMGAAPPPPTLSIGELMEGAAWSRLSAGKMWRWQSQVFLGRYIAGAGFSLLDEVHVPARWKSGEPVPVGLDSSYVLSKARRVLNAELGVVGSGRALVRRRADLVPAPRSGAVEVSVPLALLINARPVYSRTYELPLVLGERIEDVLTGVNSEDATLRVRNALDLGVRAEGDTEIVDDDPLNLERWTGVDLGVAFRVEVLYEGERVGSAEGRVPWNHASLKSWTDRVEAAWAPGATESIIQDPLGACLVVTGDLQGAWEMYREWPFERAVAAAWTGSYEVPVRVDYAVGAGNRR